MLSNKIFIEKAKKIHGNKYNYSKVIYEKAKLKVEIICKEHGIFLQNPNNHLSGNGCPKCSSVYRTLSKQERIEHFIFKAKEIHGEKYDYSLIIDPDEKLPIICKEHGIFFQERGNHIGKYNKNDCPECGQIKKAKSKMLTNEEFIKKAKEIHRERYNYSKVNYTGAHEKVTVICKTHGDFKVTPANHWSNGVGCPSCLYSNPSKGEAIIAKWLKENNIKFEWQKTYSDLWWKSNNGRLKFDFYIPEKNLIIEYDGEHHFQPISWNKNIDAEEKLKEQQIRDNMKNEYAKKHGIDLLRIRFDENVEKHLSNKFLKVNKK